MYVLEVYGKGERGRNLKILYPKEEQWRSAYFSVHNSSTLLFDPGSLVCLFD
jgi:hypothetical protein